VSSLLQVLVWVFYLIAGIGLVLLLFAGKVISWGYRTQGENLKADAVNLIRRSLLVLIPRKIRKGRGEQ